MSETPNTPNAASERNAEASYGHVLKYTWLFGGVQGLNLLISIVRTKAVALFLGPAGLGLINLYNNILGLLSQCTNLGVPFSAVKDVASKHAAGTSSEIQESIAAVRLWCLITAALGTLSALVFAPLISRVTFGTPDYTLPLVLLSGVVGMMAITGGELAILKGLKQLRRVAWISLLCALLSLVLTVPLYCLWGIQTVAAALFVSNAAVLGVHLYYSTRVAPWQWTAFSKSLLRKSLPVVRLGLAYIGAGALGQGAEYVMRTLLLHSGGMEVVGFYNCGYMLVVSYASLVFTAVESDYFPRLSGAVANRQTMSNTVNRQTEVCILLIAPVLVAFVILMPIVVRLLFSADFLHAVSMATCAVFYMFFKALTLPAAYLPLASGDSKTYLLCEAAYDVVVALAIPFAYHFWGLTATGCALSFMGLFDLLLIHLTYRRRYGYRFHTNHLFVVLAQFFLLAIGVWAALSLPLLPRCVAGTVAFAVSAALSLRILNKETHLVAHIKEKLGRRTQK